jgi:hypothetical protein
VALLFQRLFALIVVIAWLSLASQVRLLIGEEGLLPLRPLLEMVRADGSLPLWNYPSLLRWPALASDGVLFGGTLLGAALGAVALAGVRPRLCFALSTLLYLSYVHGCRTFLAFQWDNLLLECGLLAVLLPVDRPAPLAHLALRLALFKLYFESGIAKWQSPLRDWHDGSAMTFYYETAPLPTWLGYHVHHLPVWWHHFESRAAMALELVLPFAIFGPRRLRLGAAVAFTGFQLIDAATANYGFFCYLALVLHLFLLDDADVERVVARLRPRLPGALATWLGAPAATAPAWPRLQRVLALVGLAVYGGISLVEAADHFGPDGGWRDVTLPLQRIWGPLRVVNTYHLFASITRRRIEPQVETLVDGAWIEQQLWHKPGDPARAPDFVAPHQPRLDFQLWFHGLEWDRVHRQPEYVVSLMQRLCYAPEAMQPLFRARLPAAPTAVRIAYHQYLMTTRVERRGSGAYWRRILLGTSPEVPCDR